MPAFKRSFLLLALLVAFTMPMLFSSAGGGGGSATITTTSAGTCITDSTGDQNCNGTGSCTVASNGISCASTITFPKAFLNTPTVLVTTVSPGASGQKTVQSWLSFFSAQNQIWITWPNMPTTETEIFGDTGQHNVRIYSQFINGANYQVDLNVGCVSSALSDNTLLQVQFSNDLTNWINVTGANVGIGPTFCTMEEEAPGNFVNVATSLGEGFFRLVGEQGSGLGDNPVLQYAYLIVKQVVFSNGQAIPNISATTLTTVNIRMVPLFSTSTTNTVTFNWRADSPKG